jgi:hypothetical protein
MDQEGWEGKAKVAPCAEFIRRVFSDMWGIAEGWEGGCGKLRDSGQEDEPVDLGHLSGRLRKLSPRQEKVLRLCFGLGCERPHSALEMAQEFGVSAPVIAGMVGAAERPLERLFGPSRWSRHLAGLPPQADEWRRRLTTRLPCMMAVPV